jgi:hypothetical protein
MDRQQTRVFEHLDRFRDRAIIGILELCPTVSPHPPRLNHPQALLVEHARTPRLGAGRQLRRDISPAIVLRGAGCSALRIRRRASAGLIRSQSAIAATSGGAVTSIERMFESYRRPPTPNDAEASAVDKGRTVGSPV